MSQYPLLPSSPIQCTSVPPHRAHLIPDRDVEKRLVMWVNWAHRAVQRPTSLNVLNSHMYMTGII